MGKFQLYSRAALFPTVARHLFLRPGFDSVFAVGRLTARELEVLEHVVRGELNKQIGDDLGINERTVKLHRTNLTRRLHVRSVAELTRLVEAAGWFNPNSEL